MTFFLDSSCQHNKYIQIDNSYPSDKNLFIFFVEKQLEPQKFLQESLKILRTHSLTTIQNVSFHIKKKSG